MSTMLMHTHQDLILCLLDFIGSELLIKNRKSSHYTQLSAKSLARQSLGDYFTLVPLICLSLHLLNHPNIYIYLSFTSLIVGICFRKPYLPASIIRDRNSWWVCIRLGN